MTPDEIITRLDLVPHPEGGHYRQTWIEPADLGTRPSGTCIYYLLKAGDQSHWHKIDATEIWLYHAGAPLILSRADSSKGPAWDAILGPDLAAGQEPQLLVAEGQWQAARSSGAFTLVSCVVSPGFDFARFTLAPEGFDIPR